MSDFKNMSFMFSGYKAFKDVVKFDEIKNINVLIGRNNSGKSSFLDIVEFLIKDELYKLNNSDLNVPVKYTFNREVYDNADEKYKNELSHKIYCKEFEKYLREMNGKCVDFNLAENYDFYKDISFKNNSKSSESDREVDNQLIRTILNINKFSDLSCLRLNAERNIKAEKEGENVLIESNGDFATNFVRYCLNDYTASYSFMREILNQLNNILSPDDSFDNIVIQQVRYSKSDYLWEICLIQNNEKLLISQVGSGIRTILLVLLILNIASSPSNKQEIVVLFEELENNLHPALQRRLFDFIYKYAIKHDLVIFLTTHSSIAINNYYDKENAQLYHVTKTGGSSNVCKVDNKLGKYLILDDLNIKASDLLQSNGIIWVEGPSDRVYIKKWLEVFCGNKFEENVHYQFLYYGGKLLSHYSVNVDEELYEEQNNFINMLTINRNSAIVMDSDITDDKIKINDTKSRIKKEFDDKGLFCWITQGKEIENYLSKEAINNFLGNSALNAQCEKNEKFPDYIKDHYTNFISRKIQFSRDVSTHITKDNSKNILDLENQIKNLYQEIEKWNK